jgi:competence protein ComFB
MDRHSTLVETMLASIQNYYERLVLEFIQQKLSGRDEEHDADFVADLACLALNALPARYVRHAVDLWSHLGDADRTAMRQEVEDAVEAALGTMRRRSEIRPAETDDYEPARTRLPWT